MPSNYTVKGIVTSDYWIQSNAGEICLVSPAKVGLSGYFQIKYICDSIWPRYAILNVMPC